MGNQPLEARMRQAVSRFLGGLIKLIRWAAGLILILTGIVALFNEGFWFSLIFLVPGIWALPVKIFGKQKKQLPNYFTNNQAAPTNNSLDYYCVSEFRQDDDSVIASISFSDKRADRKYAGTNRPIPKANAKWMAPGEALTVAGRTLNCGNLYFGTRLPANPSGSDNSSWDSGWVVNYPDDPALINPELPVAKSNPDKAGQKMGYWPSYSDIAPECRLAYLEWLETGRTDLGTAIGYVFLYFYGLERRIIVDMPADDEIHALIEEVKRLRAIYSSNHSFDSYSLRLIEAAKFILFSRTPAKIKNITPLLNETDEDQRMVQVIGLAQQMKSGAPLSFEWAMVGYFYAVQWGKRIASQRARDVFLNLMRRRFEKKWPQGLKLRQRKNTFSFYYRGASRYIGKDLAKGFEFSLLPDPVQYDWSKLTELAYTVENDLAPYARAVGRNPALANSPEAICLLPQDIAREQIDALSANIAPWLEEIAAPIGRVKLDELAERLLGKKPEDIDQKKLRNLAQILEHMGFGFEPDPDFTKARAKNLETCVIFDARSFKGLRTAPTAAYNTATFFAALIAGITGASETGLGEEEKKWIGWIQKTFNLSELEYRRLSAHLDWLSLQKVTNTQIKRMLADIPAQQRDMVARFSAAIAAADGMIEKGEVAFLEKLYDELGVDRKSLYATLHDMAAESAKPANEPVTVSAPGEKTGRKHKINQPASNLTVEKKTGQQLDAAKINEIIQETKQVSAVLTHIFDQDSDKEVQPQKAQTAPANDTRFAGLDAAYAALTAQLLAQRTWERPAFESMAKKAGLLPDGALEAINEWAFDQFGEALIEDGVPLQVNIELVG